MCIYGGTVWQAFTLTSGGHLIMQKIDAFLNQILIIEGGKNDMKKKLFSLIAVLTTVVAASVASSACLCSAYQPEEPKCLREE